MFEFNLKSLYVITVYYAKESEMLSKEDITPAYCVISVIEMYNTTNFYVHNN